MVLFDPEYLMKLARQGIPLASMLYVKDFLIEKLGIKEGTRIMNEYIDAPEIYLPKLNKIVHELLEKE
jgi:hypothetical protein